ncbi:MAG TPA: twin-arginine translocase TatA/TatE family subunit [Pyrinomonadaceae bacterium]|nr:twin-arginine translocase TatA/TatE family subunit [Pyrinomonadaceae bacterium]
MYFGVFEFLGTSELLVILVVALVLFGPRKLPQLSRSLGKSLAEFKRASQDFKQTWDREVSLEEAKQSARVDQAMLPQQDETMSGTTGGNSIARTASAGESQPQMVAAENQMTAADSSTPQTIATRPQPARKQDWL